MVYFRCLCSGIAIVQQKIRRCKEKLDKRNFRFLFFFFCTAYQKATGTAARPVAPKSSAVRIGLPCLFPVTKPGLFPADGL